MILQCTSATTGGFDISASLLAHCPFQSTLLEYHTNLYDTDDNISVSDAAARAASAYQGLIPKSNWR